MSIYNKLKKFLPSNSFGRSVSLLAGGTAAGQLLVVISSPILTRLYTPDDFGLFAVYTSILALLGVIASMRYQVAIPLPESDYEAANLAILSVTIVIGLTLVIFLITGLYGNFVSDLLSTPSLNDYIWLISFGFLTLGIYQIFHYWAVRAKAFQTIAETKITQSFSMVAVQLLGHGIGSGGLIIGQLTGHCFGTIRLMLLARQKNFHFFKFVSRKGMIKAAFRYRHFPIYSSWGALLNNSGTQLPPLLLAANFGPSIAGFYMLSQRMLAMPSRLLGRAIGDVFFSETQRAKKNGLLSDLVESIYKRLSLIGAPPAILLALIAPELFEIVFSEAWREAGVYTQALLPFFLIRFIASPLSSLHLSLEKQSKGFLFYSALFTSQFIGLIIGIVSGEAYLAVLLYSVSSCICWGLFLIWTISLSQNSAIKLVLKTTTQSCCITLILCSPLIITLFSTKNELALIFSTLLSTISIAAYSILLYLRWTKKEENPL